MADASLDDLSAFSHVARLGSFTGAARLLGTSTSNLSHTIRRLERQVGAKLLHRNSRSVAATEDGERLLQALVPAFDEIGTALDALERGRDRISGTLRLTMTRQAYDAVIRPMLRGFLDANPEVSVEVLIDYAYRDVIADRFDAGIRLGEKIERDMIALKVGPELRMAVVASPGYLSGSPEITHPRDLTMHRCINYRMTGSGALYAWEFERGGEQFAVQVSGRLAFNEPGLMLRAALDGDGVGYLLDHEAAPHVEAGALVPLLREWLPPFPGFHLYYPSRQQPRAAFTAFLAALRSPRSTR